jgi:uncharacterized coiled-coil protein SlyX
MGGLTFKVATLEVHIEQAQAPMKDLQVQHHDLQSMVAAQAETIRVLSDQLAQQEATLQFLMTSFQSHDAQTTQQEHTVSNIAMQAARHEDTITHLQNQLNRLVWHTGSVNDGAPH